MCKYFVKHTFVPFEIDELPLTSGQIDFYQEQKVLMIRNIDGVTGKIYNHKDDAYILPFSAEIDLNDFSKLEI